MSYENYLSRVSEETIPDLDLPGTFLYTWGNGDKTIVSADSKVDLFCVLDELAYPGGGEFKRLDRGCAVHFRKRGVDDEGDDLFELESLSEELETEINPDYEGGDNG